MTKEEEARIVKETQEHYDRMNLKRTKSFKADAIAVAIIVIGLVIWNIFFK